jgi:hypothetical protein
MQIYQFNNLLNNDITLQICHTVTVLDTNIIAPCHVRHKYHTVVIAAYQYTVGTYGSNVMVDKSLCIPTERKVQYMALSRGQSNSVNIDCLPAYIEHI